MNQPVYRRAASLMEAELGDELVALDVASGSCFGFNSVATSVWKQLAQPRTVGQLQDALVGEYDVTAEQCCAELQQLVDDMVAKGLIEPL